MQWPVQDNMSTKLSLRRCKILHGIDIEGLLEHLFSSKIRNFLERMKLLSTITDHRLQLDSLSFF